MRFLLLALAGCGGFADPESEVTITQGVYGLVISGCDVGGCSDEPADDVRVHAIPDVEGDEAFATSNGGGFFQLALDAEPYRICLRFTNDTEEGSCMAVAIDENARIRCDFTSGPGGGIWRGEGCPLDR